MSRILSFKSMKMQCTNNLLFPIEYEQIGGKMPFFNIHTLDQGSFNGLIIGIIRIFDLSICITLTIRVFNSYYIYHGQLTNRSLQHVQVIVIVITSYLSFLKFN